MVLMAPTGELGLHPSTVKLNAPTPYILSIGLKCAYICIFFLKIWFRFELQLDENLTSIRVTTGGLRGHKIL